MVKLDAVFEQSLMIYKITLNAMDGNLDNESGDKILELYVEYMGKELYADENKTKVIEVCDAVKQKEGYNTNFYGWKDINNYLILSKGQKGFGVNNHGYTDENGRWIYTGDLYLIAYFEDDSKVYRITLQPQSSNVEYGLKAVYVKYDDTNIYSDRFCLYKLEKFPVASLSEPGYSIEFNYWYAVSDSRVELCDSHGEILPKTSLYSNGWKITNDLVAYPKFTITANVYVITFADENNEFYGYVQYDSQTVYKDQTLTQKYEKISSLVTQKGYTTVTEGWFNSGYSQMVIDDNGVFAESSYTLDGAYHHDGDITLYSRISFTPNIYKVTLDSGEGKISGYHSSTLDLFIIYDDSQFYSVAVCADGYQTDVPLSSLGVKGYTVEFLGYSYNGTMILQNGILTTGMWNIDHDVILTAEYNFVANVYSVTFNPDSDGGGKLIGSYSTLYIKYGTDEFYSDSLLTQKCQIPSSYNETIKDKVFSGYYTKAKNGVWVIDDELNFVKSDLNKDLIITADNKPVWGIAEDVTLYAQYKSDSNMCRINLVITGDFSERFSGQIIYAEYQTNKIYKDRFKNILISSNQNSIALSNFDDVHYDFEFTGYYYIAGGKKNMIINSDGVLCSSELLVDGKWIKNEEVTLISGYTISPKKFNVRFNAEDNGGELDTIKKDYTVIYSKTGIYDGQREKSVPSSYKYRDGYKCDFRGYSLEDGTMIYSYEDGVISIIKNVDGYTDADGKWIVGADFVLYAMFTETEYKYDATFYNYDGTIFQVVDLELDSEIILPDGTPEKPSESGKRYVFRCWDGFNYERTMIMKEDKSFYPVFDEYDIVENYDDKNIIKSGESVSIYIPDMQSQVTEVQLNNVKIVISKDFAEKISSGNYGNSVTLSVKKSDEPLSDKVKKNVKECEVYKVIFSLTNAVEISGDDVSIIFNYSKKTDYPLVVFTINEKLDIKSRVESEENDGQITMRINSNTTDTIMLAEYDEAAENRLNNILKIVLIVGGILLGGGLVILVSVKLIVKIVQHVKYKERREMRKIRDNLNTMNREYDKNNDNR